jgi:hypothetical protein
VTTPDPNAPTTTPAPTPAPAGPSYNVGGLVAVDSYDSYSGKNTTDVFLIVEVDTDPDNGTHLAVTHVGEVGRLAVFPASAVRSL